MMVHIEEQIKALEIKLLHTDMKTNPALLDELLSEDFEEIGNTGYVSSRQEVIDWLVNNNINPKWILTNFRVRALSNDLVLVIYQAKKKSNLNNAARGSMRSSIWKRHGNSWKMIFHQGSKVDE